MPFNPFKATWRGGRALKQLVSTRQLTAISLVNTLSGHWAGRNRHLAGFRPPFFQQINSRRSALARGTTHVIHLCLANQELQQCILLHLCRGKSRVGFVLDDYGRKLLDLLGYISNVVNVYISLASLLYKPASRSPHHTMLSQALRRFLSVG